MSPAPGSVFNEPDTQISFLGASASDLRGLTVTGSLSGLHAGWIEADSDGQGASFLPSVPFLAGETVSVRSHVPMFGAPSGQFSFSIGTPPAFFGDVYKRQTQSSTPRTRITC